MTTASLRGGNTSLSLESRNLFEELGHLPKFMVNSCVSRVQTQRVRQRERCTQRDLQNVPLTPRGRRNGPRGPFPLADSEPSSVSVLVPGPHSALHPSAQDLMPAFINIQSTNNSDESLPPLHYPSPEQPLKLSSLLS
jgi:hypothetical protein